MPKVSNPHLYCGQENFLGKDPKNLTDSPLDSLCKSMKIDVKNYTEICSNDGCNLLENPKLCHCMLLRVKKYSQRFFPFAMRRPGVRPSSAPPTKISRLNSLQVTGLQDLIFPTGQYVARKNSTDGRKPEGKVTTGNRLVPVCLATH